jgi:hypothetical protein
VFWSIFIFYLWVSFALSLSFSFSLSFFVSALKVLFKGIGIFEAHKVKHHLTARSNYADNVDAIFSL